MVTENPARILRLRRGFGAIVPGGPADLIAISGDGRDPAAALLRGNPPDWVFVAGKLKLSTRRSSGLHRLSLEGRGEVFVAANVPRLRRQVHCKDIRLAGRRVLE
jgi:hypothetical protein